MAAPVTHIVLADLAHRRFFPDVPRREFLIGTSFPDIRYLVGIKREITHFPDVSVRGCEGSSPFMAGAKFHSVVDNVREAYVRSRNAYDHVPASRYASQALKFFEDEVLYDRFDGWQGVIGDFATIPYAESPFPVEKKGIDAWYASIRRYFATPPTPETQKEFIVSTDLTEAAAIEIRRVIDGMRDNAALCGIIVDFHGSFLSLLEAES